MTMPMKYENTSNLSSSNEGVVCDICPHLCSIIDGDVGKCHVRGNVDDQIQNLYEGVTSLVAVDSIEKRPFFHFYPGTKFLSVGLYGCSFSCSFCVPGDTLISTPSGLKRMDQIEDGDEIIAVDCSHFDPQPVLAHVGHVFGREVEEVIELELEVDGQTIELTLEHPVLTKDRGWVEAGDLTVDDEVLCDKTYLKQLRSFSQISTQDKQKME